jgi:hypothetical protein
MLIYLDICCFNRPFDDQTQLRVRLESEAKLFIQEQIRSGNLQLAWSYMMDFENSANPFEERRINTSRWRKFAHKDIEATPDMIESALKYQSLGFKKKDSLHIACAIAAQCKIFFTTDTGIIKRKQLIHDIAILNPIDYITNHDD